MILPAALMKPISIMLGGHLLCNQSVSYGEIRRVFAQVLQRHERGEGRGQVHGSAVSERLSFCRPNLTRRRSSHIICNGS